MLKYIIVIDYKASSDKSFRQVTLEAQNILDAMNEAEQHINDSVYLIVLAERTGKTDKIPGGKVSHFKEILVNRKSGWHVCDQKHGESAATWRLTETKYGNLYEIESIDY